MAIFSLVALPLLASAATIEPGLNQLVNTGLGSRDIRDTVASIINVAMGLLGVVALVLILLGGFKWMTAGGNEEAVKKAKQLLISGIIGLIIILTAYAIATFIVGSILNATV